jgi:site-specific DNA recombinase
MQQAAQQEPLPPDPAAAAARDAIADCDRRITQYRAALDAGTNPALVTDWINQAQSEKEAAQQRIREATTAAERPQVLSREEIQQIVRDLGDLTDRLHAAPPERKRPLYQAFGLTLTYDHGKRAVTVESRPADACAYGACPRGDLNPHAR